jgi:Uma2 family endonuclease
MQAQPILTYDDYIALPEDGPRYELYEGELIVMPATSPRHQAVIVNLFIAVAQHVWGHGLGDVSPASIDVILSHVTVVQPDLVYVDTAGPGIVTDGGVEGTPTLVVEVLSPSTEARDRGVKQALYAQYGVPFYWIVDPATRTVQALRLRRDSYEAVATLDETAPAALPPLAGLRLDPTALWR